MDINVKEYLSSGILELYVSGALPEEEAREVQLLSQKYPELLKEIEAIEASIMAYAASFVGKERKVPLLKNEELEPKIISINPSTHIKESQELGVSTESDATIKRFNWRIFAVAASVLLLASVFLNLYFFQQWQHSEQQIAMLNTDRGQIAQELETLKTNLDNTLEVTGSLKRVPMKKVSEESPELLTYVYWDQSTEDIYVQVVNLPEINTEEFQYQLWAIKEGTDPISMGVFDMTKMIQLQREKVGGDVIMFAVTEEPKGGSETPTLEKMAVAGQVS